MKKLLITLYFLLLPSLTFALPPAPMYWGSLTGRIEITSDTTLTKTQVVSNQYITNQGATGEVDIKLPAITVFGVTVWFVTEEAQVIEVNPPTGEKPILDALELDTNDCVDSDNTVGSVLSATRIKNASGAWQWLLININGTGTDTGASD